MKHLFGNIVTGVKRGVILQQVNALGVMGSGIAKEIRAKWPIVWDVYYREVGLRHSHTQGAEHLGKVIPVEVSPGLWVFNLVGQQFFGRDGTRYTSYDALAEALELTGKLAWNKGFRAVDIHHPLLGCGLGGGKWAIVSAIIQEEIGQDTTLWTLDDVNKGCIVT